jgi:hypothetical protein
MASRAFFSYRDEQGVHIAIGFDTHELLDVSGCIAFSPKFITRTRPKASSALVDTDANAFRIHVSKRQH